MINDIYILVLCCTNLFGIMKNNSNTLAYRIIFSCLFRIPLFEKILMFEIPPTGTDFSMMFYV